MSDRLYWPSDYADEVMPEGAAHPTAWLYRDEESQLRIRPFYEGHVGKMVRHGDVVEFIWSEPRPRLLVTFHADGTYTTHGADAAADANHFWLYDETEVGGDSLKYIAELALDDWCKDEIPIEQEVSVCCNAWSEIEIWRAVVTETDFRFERLVTPIGVDAPTQGELAL
jgi:hypothetical protein